MNRKMMRRGLVAVLLSTLMGCAAQGVYPLSGQAVSTQDPVVGMNISRGAVIAGL